MSYQASRWARDQVTGSLAAKAVLLILAEQASAEDASCTLSTAALAERTETARTTVIKALGALENRALITRSRRINAASGHRMSDEIRLLMPEVLSPSGELREWDQSPSGGLGPKSVLEGTKVRLSGDQSPSGGPHIDKGLVEGLVEGKRASARRAIPIEEGFPDQSAIDREQLFLRSQGWNISASLEADSFRSHAQTHDRRVKVWAAAFHNWILGAIRRAPPNMKLAVVTSASLPAVTPWRARLKAFRHPANGYWNDSDWGPRPGKTGCMAPAEITAEFGYGPANVVPLNRTGAA